MNNKDTIHQQIVRNLGKVDDWFRGHREKLDVPFYSSYDIRDAGYKTVNVDANIYPAGFNNICQVDRDHAGEAVQFYLERHYGSEVRKILILTEEHTNNPYYWDNIYALREMIKSAGFEVRVGFPRAVSEGPIVMKTASGREVQACTALIAGGKISVKDYEPDLIVSNNDFSEFYAEWGPEILNPMNPPRELGWYQRKKSTYFHYYNELAADFARLIDVDPWWLTVETELFNSFDMADDASREALAMKTDAMLKRLRDSYAQRGIQEEPFVFIKNNSGTYGLAVMRIRSADEVRALNYKTRKKMKAAKGGRDVEEVILQEGVPTSTRAEGATAEPAVYMVGCRLVGGFLRTHAEKDETESLNSPGAVYKRLCVTDLKVSVEGHPLENVYGWIAKLGVLAIGMESASMKVQYRGYTKGPC